MLFPTVFSCCFYAYFTWRWFDAFYYFITTCKTSSIKIWFVVATGLAENLTQVVFRQPFVIQHARTRLLGCETWNFLFCIFFHHYIINYWCLMLLYFLLLLRVISWFESQKCMIKPYHTVLFSELIYNYKNSKTICTTTNIQGQGKRTGFNNSCHLSVVAVKMS